MILSLMTIIRLVVIVGGAALSDWNFFANLKICRRRLLSQFWIKKNLESRKNYGMKEDEIVNLKFFPLESKYFEV